MIKQNNINFESNLIYSFWYLKDFDVKGDALWVMWFHKHTKAGTFDWFSFLGFFNELLKISWVYI